MHNRSGCEHPIRNENICCSASQSTSRHRDLVMEIVQGDDHDLEMHHEALEVEESTIDVLGTSHVLVMGFEVSVEHALRGSMPLPNWEPREDRHHDHQLGHLHLSQLSLPVDVLDL